MHYCNSTEAVEGLLVIQKRKVHPDTFGNKIEHDREWNAMGSEFFVIAQWVHRVMVGRTETKFSLDFNLIAFNP